MNLLSNLLRLPLMRLSYRCGGPARAPTSLQADANACDQVRKDMLAQVARCEGAEAALLRLRVQRAPDMASLWDLRTRSMQLLAAQFGESDARRGRRDKHNRTAASMTYRGRRRANESECRSQVGGNDVVPVFGRRRVSRLQHDRTGQVDGGVEPAVSLNHRLDGAPDGVDVARVEGQDVSPHLVRESDEFPFVATGQDQRRPLCGQATAERRSDPASGSDNEYDGGVEAFRHLGRG